MGNKFDCILVVSGETQTPNFLTGYGTREVFCSCYYSPELLKKSAAMFEGIPCKLDHSVNSEGVAIGYFTDVRYDERKSGIRGTLVFNSDEFSQRAKNSLLDVDCKGLSIQARVKESLIDPRGNENFHMDVFSFEKIFSCDIVNYPNAGGKILSELE